ncbi:phage major capsid protein [Rickettsiales endosymbiont of Trichoplax sp. H2]|uniref:phage major capsid protein n=1 Tax=Rickettsiales endosymbiont of Trichoplax sp. H2 TaxID=2021221 RepID=UPI0012B2AA98|nr:phage major capsid protein [Rickettsiales endosymbiont of Trichoplax sp. H2]MSO13275.1 hypothetical protein [Rickettsiales endosymbiont of Trichoplax sp. H2]
MNNITNNDIATKTNKIGSTWEQFKSINDRRINEIEKKGSADSVTLSHLDKINKSLDRYQDSLNKIESVLNRPASNRHKLNETNCEYKNAFCKYVKKGLESDIANLEQKNLNNSADQKLGYSVTNKMNQAIDTLLVENSPMRKISSVLEISTDSLELIEDREDITSGWSETGLSGIENSKETVFTKKIILTHELYAQPKVTQKLVDDPRIDVEDWLSKKLSNIFIRQENSAFINGNGIGQPKGILSYEDGNEWGKIERIKTESNKLNADDIIKLFFSIKEIYSNNTNFLMSRDSLQKVRMLKDKNGQYLWQPNLSEGGFSTLFGSKIYISTDMPCINPGKISIAFGNFKNAYQIIDRGDVRVLRDPFTHKPYIKFYSTKKVGGDIVNFEAIKLLEIAS